MLKKKDGWNTEHPAILQLFILFESSGVSHVSVPNLSVPSCGTGSCWAARVVAEAIAATRHSHKTASALCCESVRCNLSAGTRFIVLIALPCRRGQGTKNRTEACIRACARTGKRNAGNHSKAIPLLRSWNLSIMPASQNPSSATDIDSARPGTAFRKPRCAWRRS